MTSLRTLSCQLALAAVIPCTAFADPVVVSTRASGTIDVNPAVFDRLWPGGQALDRMPFQLSMSSVLQSDSLVTDANGTHARDLSTQLHFDFKLGDYDYHKTILADVGVDLYQQGDGTDVYRMLVSFGPSYNDSFTTMLFGPAGSFGATPLTPVTLGSNLGLAGNISMFLSPDNPDATPFWGSMAANTDSVSLQVMSAVPEPAPFGMLAAGVMTLGCWRWRTSRRV